MWSTPALRITIGLYVLLAASRSDAGDPTLWRAAPVRGSRAAADSGLRVQVSPSLLMRSADSAPATFLVDFGSDGRLTAIVERTRIDSPTRYVSFGRFVDLPDSDFLCLVDQGRVAGVFAPAPDQRYLILPTEQWPYHRVTRTPADGLLPSSGIRPPEATDEVPQTIPVSASPTADLLAPPSVIDVLILYTQTAARVAGGGQAGIELLAQLAIEQANDAYADSGVEQQLRLAHTALISYNESGSAALDLEYLTRPADGIMDDAITLRQDYRADLVHLLVGYADQTDLGWLNNFSTFNATWTFSVSMAINIPNDVFTRAIGRNQGLDHDWVDPQTGVFPYSYGYTFTGQSGRRYSTIMSNGTGTRIRRHSNPAILYDGVPMGRAITGTQPASAADSLNLTRTTIAAIANNVTVPPPVISSPVTATGTVDRDFEYQITATNGPDSFGAAGLPLGLVLNTQSGLISGNPRPAGVYRIDLSATNPGGTGVKVLTLTVDEPSDCPLQRVARRWPSIPGLTAATPQTLQTLLADCREFRDGVLKATPEGQQLIAAYYEFGPTWMARLQQHPAEFLAACHLLVEVAPKLRQPAASGTVTITAQQSRQVFRICELLERDAPANELGALADVRHWYQKFVRIAN